MGALTRLESQIIELRRDLVTIEQDIHKRTLQAKTLQQLMQQEVEETQHVEMPSNAEEVNRLLSSWV